MQHQYNISESRVGLAWKLAADEAQAPAERKFLRRVRAAQVLLLLVLLAGTALLSLSGVLGIAWLTAGLFALAIVMNSVFVVPWVVRRQLEIRFQEGVWPQPPPDATQATDRAAALRQAWKQSLSGLMTLAVCCAFLPWRKNWLGCVGYLAVPALCVLWSARRRYRQFLELPGTLGSPPPFTPTILNVCFYTSRKEDCLLLSG